VASRAGWGVALWSDDAGGAPLAVMRAARGEVRAQAVGQDPWGAFRRQPWGHLLDQALRQRQGALTPVTRPDELGDRGHVTPHPRRRARQAGERLGLAAVALWDGAASGAQRVPRHPCAVPMAHALPRTGLAMCGRLHQPAQAGMGIRRPDAGHGVHTAPPWPLPAGPVPSAGQTTGCPRVPSKSRGSPAPPDAASAGPCEDRWRG
jgi:hypothetical protein